MVPAAILQAPPTQASVPLHRSPSSKSAQSASVSQSHGIALPPHPPAVQTSPLVQGSPSLQATPSSGTSAHIPVAGSQAEVRHDPAPPAGQITTLSGSTWQVSPTQTSVPLHRLSSSNAAQSASSTQAQPAESPGTHSPPAHASPSVQPLPSSHGAVLWVYAQPVAASQLSSVHAL